MAAAYTAELTAALSSRRSGDAVAAFLRRVGMPDAVMSGMRGSPAWQAMEALAPTLGYDDALIGDSPVPVEWERIRVPVLALAGGSSPDFLQYGSREVARIVADGRYASIEGQGHDATPDALAAHLAPFLID